MTASDPALAQTSGAASAGAVTFSATSLDGLTHQVNGWLAEHPDAHVLGFSHAAESRLVHHTPPSLAGLEPRVTYTAILLLSPQSNTHSLD